MKSQFNSIQFNSIQLLLLLLTLTLITCKKEESIDLSLIKKSNITINEAKSFFSSKLDRPENISIPILTTRTTEVIKEDPEFNIDWQKGTIKFDTAIQKTVADFPLINGPLSSNIEVSQSSNTDEAAMSNLFKKPNHRLIITKDLNGNLDYAIMKIVGTYNYLQTKDLQINNFSFLDQDFNGGVIFVDVYDNPLGYYKIVNGAKYKAKNYTSQIVNANTLSTRWERICIRFYVEITCPCEGHSSGDHCSCPTQPRRLYDEICWDTPHIGSGNNSSGGVGGDTDRGWTWSSGGSGGSGTNTRRSPAQNANDFDLECGVIGSMNDHEDIALACSKISDDKYSITYKICMVEGLKKKGIDVNEKCKKDYYKAKYGLTDEEYEEYKEDKECKNSAENKAKIEKFKSDISKAIENELKQLALDLPGVPFDADLLKSIMSKVILKKTGKLIPLVGVGLDIVELKAAYAAGDYVAMGLSIGSILTEVIPCAMIIDLGLDAASIGNTIFKAYKSLNELKSFLASNSILFKAISETIEELDLIDALDWIKKGSSNIGQFAVSLGGKTVDEFLELLATKLGKSWTPSGNAKYIDLPGVKINYYPASSSGGIPTIQFIINNLEFKIRLNP